MDRDAKVVSAGGVSRKSLLDMGGLAAAGVAAAAVAASCGSDGAATSPGDSGKSAAYAFAGLWTFSSAKPTYSCKGPPLEARDLVGHTVTLVSSDPSTVIYQDLGCSVPLTVHGSRAASTAPVSCPVGASGLESSFQSVELVAKDPNTLTLTMQATVKGGSASYDCTSSVTAEIRRNPS